MHIDLLIISFILFGFTIFFSSLLNGFVGFNLTAVFMISCTAIIYLFSVQNKHLLLGLSLSLYISTILFLFTFIFSNFSSLIHFNFDRLGSEFGNINDIAIFLGLGIAMSLYYSFSKVKLLYRILNIILSLVFIYCGLSTGTKMIFLTTTICLAATIILFFGRKKWYFSIIILSLIAITAFIVLSLPAFSTLRERLMSMLSTLFGVDTGQNTFIDYSSLGRFHMFINGVEMMARKPLFGYGYHGFHNYSSFGKAWSHNNFSEMLACFGCIGTCLFFFPFVCAAIGAPKKIKENKQNSIFFIVLLFFFVCMFSFAFDTQKIYSFSIGIIYASLVDTKKKYVLSIPLSKKMEGQQQ